MKRRKFLRLIGQASAAFLAFESKLISSLAQAASASALSGSGRFFSEEKIRIIKKIIDGMISPELEIQQKIDSKDPSYQIAYVFDRFVTGQHEEVGSGLQLVLWAINELPAMPGTDVYCGKKLDQMETDREITAYFIKLRDSKHASIRNLFRAVKMIASVSLYANETVVWKEIAYPGPLLADVNNPDEDLARSTSFSLAAKIEEGIDVLKRSVVTPQEITGKLKAGRVVKDTGTRLVLETDVVVIGSGAGGSVVASELASKTGQRVLILEKGSFVEPKKFLQRETYSIPKFYMEPELTSSDILGKKVPLSLDAVMIAGKLVGGGATINHAFCFDLPDRVLEEWRTQFGVGFDRAEMATHFAAIRKLLGIRKVYPFQVNRNNSYIGKGANALGYLDHHGVADRNSVECIGCGFCDQGCRYNRKQTPLNVILPLAAKHGAQIIPDCTVDRIKFVSTPSSRGRGRPLKVHSVIAYATDANGKKLKEIEIKASKVILAAGAIASSRILLRSDLNVLRQDKGSKSTIGERFSCHAPITFYGEFKEPIYPSIGGPPQSYYFHGLDVPGFDHSFNTFKLEGIFNHPQSMSQLVPFRSPAEHWEIMKKYNHIMTTALIFRDRSVGKIGLRSLEYKLPEQDWNNYIIALRTMAEIIFAAGAQRVFAPTQEPLFLDHPREINEKITRSLLADGKILFTSAHLMGGNAMGNDPKRDVVDPFGESWDVCDLYVADSSVFPTSIGVNPMLTVLALSSAIARRITDRGIN